MIIIKRNSEKNETQVSIHYMNYIVSVEESFSNNPKFLTNNKLGV